MDVTQNDPSPSVQENHGAPSIAVAFVVREKFGWALPALRRLYQHTTLPFKLYLVDCGYPKGIRQEIDEFLDQFTNVQVFTASRFLLPNESLNVVVERSTEQLIVLLQNDVLIEAGFLEELTGTQTRTGADIVWPMTYEVAGGVREPHRDEYTDMVMREDGDKLLVQQERPCPLPEPPPPERPIQHFEMHTLLFTRKAVTELGPFAALNSREHLDCAAGAYRKGLKAMANTRAEANYVLPPLRPHDVAYFRFRWDEQRAHLSHAYVAKRWNIEPFPIAMGFVIEHGQWARPEKLLGDNGETSEAEYAAS